MTVAGAGPRLALVWVLAAALAGASFAAGCRFDFDPAGEGFLWYGTTRARYGDVPLRDFRSYDPGRYYWGAAWARLFGDGLIVQRAAAHAFAGVGLACGLLAARRIVRGFAWAGAGVLLALWMWPPDKLYDGALATAAVLVVVRLLERPTAARHFAAGAFVGLAGWFGRNHGLYSLLAVLGATAWLLRTHPTARAVRLGGLAAGIAAGSLPNLLLALVAPGYLDSVLVSSASHLARGFNIPHPAPWPWRVSWAEGWRAAAWPLALGLCFLGYVVVLLIGMLAVARRPAEAVRVRPLLVASALVAIPYAHHVADRSDLFHLATAMGPALLLAVSLLQPLQGDRGRAVAAAAWLLIAALTVIVPGRRHPGVEAWLRWPALVPRDIAGDRLWIDRHTAGVIQLVRQAARPRGPEARVWLAPDMPGLYCVLGQRAPVWDILPIWPADPGAEARMVEELEAARVDLAVLRLAPIGRPDWDFPRTHPAVWAYVERTFERLPAAEPGALAVFVRRERQGARSVGPP